MCIFIHRDDAAPKMQREEQPPPEVSKDKFFEVSKSLKDTFSSGSSNVKAYDDNAPFTFFSQEDDEEEDSKCTGEIFMELSFLC